MTRCRNWFLDALPIAVFQCDMDGECRYISEGWTRITGIGVDECQGSSFERFIHPEDIPRFHDFIHKALENRDGDHADTFRYLNHSGDYIWLECHARTTDDVDARGTVVAGTLTNISDRVDEESLLMAHHRTLSGMMNDLPGMAYRCRNNPDWTMEFVSGGSLALTGYSPEDIVDNHVLSYGHLIHPEDSDMVWSEVQRGIRENRRFEIHYRIVTASGKIKWVWENGKGVFSPSNELLGIEGFITEMSIDNERLDSTLDSGSLYDPLTGTPSLALLLDRITHFDTDSGCGAGGWRSMLFCIHLEYFERLTEGCSPEALSRAHLDITRRIRSALADRDSICRLSNGRYAVFVEQIKTPADELLQTLRDRFLEPLPIEDRTLFVNLFAGAVDSFAGRSAAHCLDGAITALNQAREMGSGRVIMDQREPGQAQPLSS